MSLFIEIHPGICSPSRDIIKIIFALLQEFCGFHLNLALQTYDIYNFQLISP